MGAPPGPGARTGAVSLGDAAGVDVADETPEPADPQAASARATTNRRTRIETKVMAFTGS
jgi:hypothetical protein